VLENPSQGNHSFNVTERKSHISSYKAKKSCNFAPKERAATGGTYNNVSKLSRDKLCK